MFIELSKRLDERFQNVLVGTNDDIDGQLPANIISIHKTDNQKELAEIYSATDLFVNPTREENYPTVNMESIACGTPVLTFNTGGSPEILDSTYLHSVRDSYTEKKLKQIGIDNVINTSCPTMWRLTEEFCSHIPCKKQDTVVTTITDYRKNIERAICQ